MALGRASFSHFRRVGIVEIVDANCIGTAAEINLFLGFRNSLFGTKGFDVGSPLTRSTGKATVAAALIAQQGSLALIGDGVTDVAARDGGAFVIGFGGVARREAVVASANAFITGPSLTDVADYLLG